ncbi:ABC transporter ATP-binding protein [Clostridiaceae bacterium HSG29]|nr:ABC transporter ATP-binding protein [Clostridiaceae bacterium HSG29]
MIEISNLSKKYNENIIFKSFNLTIENNQITTILGPSGCGKTTLLNLISEIDTDYSGDITGLNHNKISYIFQEPRLLNWLTVYENIELVENNEELIKNILEIVDLENDINLYPPDLSGGMKQRVSIARAFCYPSDLLLMDEGFIGLDLKMKLELIKYFIKIWQNNKKTVIYITHDIDEALLISDRIIQFSNKPITIINDITIDVDKNNRLNNKIINNYKEKLIKTIL